MGRLWGIAVAAVLLAVVGLMASATPHDLTSPAPKKFTLVIDAGHGGHDPGAVGKTAKEKNINLATALAFGRLVEANCPNVTVIYTRKTDVFVTLQGRAQIANKNKADLFVSIHTNALPKGKIARGAETYTLGMARASANLEVAKRENSVILVESDYKSRYHGFDPNSSESYIIFEMLQDQNMAQSVQLAQNIQSQFHSAGRLDKGVHQAGFLVLRETTMPSVLVELGYITTSDEEQFLSSKAGSDKMGRAIYNAFVSYYNQQTSASHDNAGTAAPVEQAPDQASQQEPATKPVEQPPVVEPEPGQQQHEQEQGTNEASVQKPIEFRVQFASSNVKMNVKKYPDLKNLYCYKDNGLYKYTAGCFARYADAQKYRNQVAKKYKGAFVIALREGVRIDVNEARKQTQ